MNHLCGLPGLDGHGGGASSPLSDLADAERNELDSFRRRHESALRRAYNKDAPPNHDDDDDDDGREEKKDSSPSPVPLPSPAYELREGERLPPSGLRPLDDVTLYRYLLADRRADGTFDAEASYQRLTGALQFRKRYEVDAIVRHLTSSSIPADIQKSRRLRVGIWAGADRQSRPVVFERLGQFFSSGNVSKLSEDEWMNSYLYFLETHFREMRKSARRSGRAVDRIVYFADFQGVVSSILNRKIWKVVPLLKSMVKTVECHYPEIVDHIVLFNVPRVASAVYNVIKGFLDPVTAAKIELFPGVPLEKFKELMGEDVIPKEYGGRNKVRYPQTASK